MIITPDTIVMTPPDASQRRVDPVAINVGFTGTRHGMTRVQHDAVAKVVRELLSRMPAPVPRAKRVHHGLCFGADAEFHGICRDLWPGPWIVGHPATSRELQADVQCDERRTPLAYMQRNRNIVLESHVLIAAPRQLTRRTHGGTWRTVGIAEEMSRMVIVVWRDGLVTRHHGGIPVERPGVTVQ